MTPDEICARLAAARPARDERNRRILEARRFYEKSSHATF
jgi:hypothetical protein